MKSNRLIIIFLVLCLIPLTAFVKGYADNRSNGVISKQEKEIKKPTQFYWGKFL